MKDVTEIVPKEAWVKLAEKAGDVFVKILYPLTATTEGIGRLIEIKFNKLADEQKIIAAKLIEEVNEKINVIDVEQGEINVIKPSIIYVAFDNIDALTDETMRSLWANLLSKEFTDGDVHPEIAKILSNLTSKDAYLLLEIAKNHSIPLTVHVLKAMATRITLGVFAKRKTYNHTHLENLGLIEDVEKEWLLTTAGKELLHSVSDSEGS